MKMHHFFPLVTPSKEFRDKLKVQVLEVYDQNNKSVFNWKWLWGPSIVLTSLLLILVQQIQKTQQFVATESTTKSNQYTFEQEFATDTNDVTEQRQSVAADYDLGQVEADLLVWSVTLESDRDLDAAIAFNNL